MLVVVILPSILVEILPSILVILEVMLVTLELMLRRPVLEVVVVELPCTSAAATSPSSPSTLHLLLPVLGLFFALCGLPMVAASTRGGTPEM